MKHAASSTIGVLRRVALPVSAAGLLVASTLGLSMASANAVGDGGPNENCAPGQTQITFEGNQLTSRPIMTEGGFTVTIFDVKTGGTSDSDSPTVTLGNDIRSFDFTASAGLVNVLVKGGTEVNRVIGTENADGTFSGNDVTAAVNEKNKNGKTFGVSNVKFCFAAAPATPTATMTVSPSPSTSVSPSASPTATVSTSPSPSTSASPSASPTTSVSMSPSPSPSPTTSATGGTGTTGGTPTTGGTGSGGGTGTIGGGSGGGAGSPTTDDGTSGNGGGTAAGGPDTGGGLGQPTSGQPSALPFTGLVLDGLVVVALWAFGIGLLLMALGRRRSSLVS